MKKINAFHQKKGSVPENDISKLKPVPISPLRRESQTRHKRYRIKVHNVFNENIGNISPHIGLLQKEVSLILFLTV